MSRRPHLEPKHHPAIRDAGPSRQFVRQPKPIGRMDPLDDMTWLADKVLARIRRHRRLTTAGSYVLADEEGRVYVLADGANTTAPYVAHHARLVVGLYADGSPVVFPTSAQLLSAIRTRLIALVPALLYGAIRREEG